VVELSASAATVIRCLGAPAAIEAPHAPAPGIPCRVAPDELLVLAPPDAGERVLAGLVDDLAGLDPSGIALDQTDGFSLWTLAGEHAGEAFARLSATPLPALRPGAVQGLVGRVPAKTLVLPGELHILVASTVGHYVRERILEVCADLGVDETAPQEFRGAGVVV
jgi:hypothetical protein